MFLTIGILLLLNGFWTTKLTHFGITSGIMGEWVIIKILHSMLTTSSFTKSLSKLSWSIGLTTQTIIRVDWNRHMFGLTLSLAFIHGLLLKNLELFTIMVFGLTRTGKWYLSWTQQLLKSIDGRKWPLKHFIMEILGLDNTRFQETFGSNFMTVIKECSCTND